MEVNDKRIAKNSLMLYSRMFLSMIVGLYTSRVVLQTLGVEDFGIYGVVGGIVTMMGFLNSSMNNVSSRYIAFELGKGANSQLKQIFCTAVIIHLLIASIIVIIGETIGMWFLCNKLVIPESRLYAAKWVLQLSILSAAISITQTPYSACIIAHEKMEIYAYFELLHVFLKLLIVYLLVVSDWDKLIVYSILVATTTIFMQVLYRFYCVRNYKESSFEWIWNRPLIKNMIAFTSQNIFAHFSFSVRQQGVNFVLNMLFGVAVNAACGLVSTIQGIVLQFSNNILVAFNPQIIKNYSKNDYSEMNRLMINASKYSMLLLLLFIIPLVLELPQVLQLWLGMVPEHTVIFARISLISLITCLTNPLYTGLLATGKIKQFSTFQGTLYLITPFIVYFICSLYGRPYISYLIIFLFQMLISLANIYFLKKNIPSFSISLFVKSTLFDVILPSLLVAFVLLLLKHQLQASFLRTIVLSFLSIVLLSSITFVRMDKSTRSLIIHKVFNKV